VIPWFELAFPGVEDGGDQGRVFTSCRCRECLATQERTQSRDLKAWLAFAEPQLRVPLAPGIVILTRMDQAPLVAVGQQGDPNVRLLPQPLVRSSDEPATSAHAEAMASAFVTACTIGIHKDRQQTPVWLAPQAAWPDRFAPLTL
jgi:hypothetical protein